MGVRFITNEADGYTAMYCSTSMVTFGPVMHSVDEGEAFCKWLEDHGNGDPRRIPVDRLCHLHTDFRRHHRECERCGLFAFHRATDDGESVGVCDSCESSIEEDGR